MGIARNEPGRRWLIVTASLLGLLGSFAGLALLYVGPTLAADARTENVTGPGVDVFLIDRWPAPGSSVRIEVEGRGGSAVGLHRVGVWSDGHEVAHAEGEGVTWGWSLSSRGRASEAVVVEVPIRADAIADVALPITIHVDYTVALTSGDGTFDNVRREDVVSLELVPRVGTGAIVARVEGALGAMLALAVWGAICALIAYWLKRYDQHGGGRAEGEALAVPLLMLMLASTLLGFWVFARPLASVLGAMEGLDWGLAVAWVIVPPPIAWRAMRDVVSTDRWDLRPAGEVTKDGYRAREVATPSVERAAIVRALEARNWLVRVRGDRIDARLGKGRMIVRAPERFSALDELRIESSRDDGPIAIAVALTSTFGAIVAAQASIVERVEPGETVEAVMERRARRVLEEIRKMFAKKL